MMSHEIHKSIQVTKQGFEDSFAAGTFYNQQTRDDQHLELILNCLDVKAGMKILDLGTGTGFLAFPLAENYPQAEVTGLDIVEKALCRNRLTAEDKGLGNLHFISYDGISFPFADDTFDLVVSRYAFHHFPDIRTAFQEVSRVLKPEGKLFLSDPAPNENDTSRFVDAYMQLKKDGHIKFYTKMEWQEISRSACLINTDGFETFIRFPRKRENVPKFQDMLRQFDSKAVKGYNIEITADEIWITERVNNLLFQKTNDAQFELKQLSVSENGIAEYNMLQNIDANENGFTNEVNGMTFDEYRAWLVDQDDYSNARNLPENFIPQTTYFLYKNTQPIGIARIRHFSSSFLEKQGVGNFGYGITKTYRGKGYGHILFNNILTKCKALGYTKIKSYVDVNNTASNKVFIKNGANCIGVYHGVKNIYEILI